LPSELLFAIINWIDGLPRWLRPILNGGVLVLAWFTLRGGLVFVPVLVLLAGLRVGWQAAGWLVTLPLVAVAAGVGGGAVYSILLPLRRLGPVGIWLAWVLAVAGYLVPVLAWIAISPFHNPDPLQYSDPGVRFAWALASLWGGSLGYWCFGRDDLPSAPDIPAPTARGILSRAVAADIEELRATSQTSTTQASALEQVLTGTPSKALVMHWWRVVGRLGRVPGASLWNLPHRWALDRAEAKLRAAQAQWDFVRNLDV
jgi:hypothetical protein